MSTQVKLVFLLTFLIHLMSMLSYAVRIAGVRTRRAALSLALFNILCSQINVRSLLFAVKK